MIVQPTPTNPRTRRLRARRIAGLVAAPVLLAVVVIAGFAGSGRQAAPGVVGDAASSGAPSSSDGPATPKIPSMFGDLQAMEPSEDLDDDATLTPSDAIALSGYLGVDAAESACGEAPGAPFGAWCDRRGILAQAPWTTGGTAPFPGHLRVHIPVGVRLPSSFEQATTTTALDPVPVLVVGRRSVRPAACQGWGPAVCDDELEIDRVAWAGGAAVGLTPLIDDRLDTERRPNPFVTSLDAADLPLLAVLGWPEDVWRLDPEAGAAAVTGVKGEPVWYVRVIDGGRGPGPERRVRWMLLAERDLRVLASGRPGTPTTASIDRG
jgi:hypothetical protein